MPRSIIFVLMYHRHKLLENMVVSIVRSCGCISRLGFSIYFILTLRSGFPIKTLYIFFISPMHAPCPNLLIFVFYEEYKY
jgi:hypothetical protein